MRRRINQLFGLPTYCPVVAVEDKEPSELFHGRSSHCRRQPIDPTCVRAELNSDEETQVIGKVDLSMARLDSIETTRRLRSLLPWIPIIGMSCHTRGMVEQALLSIGGDAFLPKETLPEDLLPSIKKALHRRG